ncbi:hypothetical protein DDE83_000014 [Stemphylium lycopersici]|uniref:Uncharacterized protein n=1 Tax=Stemphylium lycopersici TaxID=183478 RepID=A0A364NGP1_STELY|nr:hypothetical protein DDE83_000014 [Stemphylium lycopersici]
MARTSSIVRMTSGRVPQKTPAKQSSRPSKPRAPGEESPHEQTVLPEAESVMESETPKTMQGDRAGHNSETREAIECKNRAASASNTKLIAVQVQAAERLDRSDSDKGVHASGESTSPVEAELSEGYLGVSNTIDEKQFSSPGRPKFNMENTGSSTRDADDRDIEATSYNYEQHSNGSHSQKPSNAHGTSRPAFEPLNWRASDRFRETGVHSFNTSFEDLREMAQTHILQAARNQRPQSVQDLRKLFTSALTDNKSLLEEQAVVNARMKLQGTRNAAYGIRLKERMTTLRLYAARASRQPRGVIAELAGLVRNAQTELGIAEEAVKADVEEVQVSKNAFQMLTTKAPSDTADLDIDADAERRQKMIRDIDAMIEGYRKQLHFMSTLADQATQDDTTLNDDQQSASISLPSMNTMHPPMPVPHRRRRMTQSTQGTTQSLEALEARLSTVMAGDVTRELINLLRIIAQKGYQQKKHLASRRNKIRDLILGAESAEVEKMYSDFALSHNALEHRLSYKLPILGDEKKNGEEGPEEKSSRTDGSILDDGEKDEAVKKDQLAISPAQKAVECNQNGERLELLINDEVDVSADVYLPAQPQSIASGGSTRAIPPSLSLDLPKQPAPPIPTGVNCDKHSNGVCTIVPIQNPEAFPLLRIQEIQADYYPSTHILAMWLHCNEDDQVSQVTADLDKGSVDHVLINDPRIITSLGLREQPYDAICLKPGRRVDETYEIRLLPNQARRNSTSWIAGELMSARHAYLFWLDVRQCADPEGPPTAAEAKAIAVKTGRRAWNVKQEIDRYWEMEYGSGGRHVRDNRELHLGEDPKYSDSAQQKSRGRLWT